MMTLIIIVLGVAAAGLLHLSKSGAAWAKPTASACAIVAIVLALVKMITSGPDTAGEIMSRYDSYQEICGEVLGTTIAERHPEARVTILTPPRMLPFGYKIIQESLQTTLEANGLTVTVEALEAPEISPETKAQILPEGMDMTAEEEEGFLRAMLADIIALEPFDLREILADLEDEADVAVLMAAYSEPIQDAGLPPKGSGPALVMLDVDINDALPLLQDTVLDTVVSSRKDSGIWKPGAKKPRKKKDAFNQQYELITANNQP